MYEKDLTVPLAEFRAKVDVTITEATGPDIDQVAEQAVRQDPSYDLARARADILDRIGRGGRCFVAKIGGRVVHSNWLIFDWVESWPGAGQVSVLDGTEAYCTYAYTVEEWRGRAIHTEVLYRMLAFLRQAGYRMAYTGVASDNEASWKTHRRLGWRLGGVALHFKPHNRDRVWVWGASWGARAKKLRAMRAAIRSEADPREPRPAREEPL